METKTLTLEDYTLFGEGATSKVYRNVKDENLVLKVFNTGTPFSAVEKEFQTSKHVFALGLSTPEVYEIVKVDGKDAILFQRIVNKVSFSRAIANNPDKLEELMSQFALECRKLHNTEADTSFFPDQAKCFIEQTKQADFLSDEQKAKVLKLIEETPNKTTCLHGDMHMGNIVLANGKPYWIDLGTFGYGNPIYDLMILYIDTCVFSHMAVNEEIFHLNTNQMLACWKAFVKAYFDISSEEDIAKKTEEIGRYAIIFVIEAAVALGAGLPPEGGQEMVNSLVDKI